MLKLMLKEIMEIHKPSQRDQFYEISQCKQS